MGVVYYKYKCEKEIYSVPVLHAFISVSELKQHILTSDRHGRGRTRGRGPREDIAISNFLTGEEYADGSALVPQNTTVLVRRTAGQLAENIVLLSSRKVTEGCSAPSSKSVITDSSSKSCCSTEVQDEDAAIAAVVDAAELKPEEHSSKRGQACGRFTSGHHYGHGPLEGEKPPPGYICRSCGVPGHFIQHCSQENKTPPPGYICYRCRIPGHFIHHCPTIGDPNFEKNKMNRFLAPVVTVNPIDGFLESLIPSASVNAVDDLPAELHCRLCKKVMIDAVLTSKCCFDSFCDKCIRGYIIAQSKCICGVQALADDLIPNQTLRSTISNMLATRTSSGTTKHISSSGSNRDPKSQSHTLSAVSEREMKQSTDEHLPAASEPDVVLQVVTENVLVNQPLEKLTANIDLLSKNKDNSADVAVEKTVGDGEVLKPTDRSGSTSKVSSVSGALEYSATRTDKLKKKRKKTDLTNTLHPSHIDYGYNAPFDPAYYNPLVSGYPWVNEPYLYGSMGMPFGGYPMGPYGGNPINGLPPQALAMQCNPGNYSWHETQPTIWRDAEAAAALSRNAERPKGTVRQTRSSNSEHNRQSQGSETKNRTRSSTERDHGRFGRASDDYRSGRASDDHHEDHSGRKRRRVSSPIHGDKPSSRRSRHGSRSLTREEDSSDDDRNFKRRWGRRLSVAADTRH